MRHSSRFRLNVARAALALSVVDLPTVLLNHGVQLVVIALKAVQRGCLVAERDVWP